MFYFKYEYKRFPNYSLFFNLSLHIAFDNSMIIKGR